VRSGGRLAKFRKLRLALHFRILLTVLRTRGLAKPLDGPVGEVKQRGRHQASPPCRQQPGLDWVPEIAAKERLRGLQVHDEEELHLDHLGLPLEEEIIRARKFLARRTENQGAPVRSATGRVPQQQAPPLPLQRKREGSSWVRAVNSSRESPRWAIPRRCLPQGRLTFGHHQLQGEHTLPHQDFVWFVGRLVEGGADIAPGSPT